MSSYTSSSAPHANEYEVICISTLTPNDEEIRNGDNDETDIRHDCLLTPASPAWHVSFSRDGLLLATSHASPENCIRIWSCCCSTASNSNNNNKNRWHLVCKLSGVHERTIRCTEFGPHYILASASFDGTICIWEPAVVDQHPFNSISTPRKYNWECTAQLEGHDNEVKAVAWNAVGSLLATCGRDKTVWVWECIWPNRAEDVGNNGEGEFDCVAVLNGHEADVKFVTFIQKPHCSSRQKQQQQREERGESLISTSYDNSIKIWEEDEEGGEWYCVLTLNGHTNTVWGVSPYWSYTAASNEYTLHMVSASHDSSLAIWRYDTTGKELSKVEISKEEGSDGVKEIVPWTLLGTLATAHEGAVYSINCTSPSLGLKTSWMASGGEDNCINVYQEACQDSYSSSNFTLERPKSGLNQLEAVDGTSICKKISRLTNAHDGDVNCVRWSPTDGTLLASAGDDGLVRLWRVKEKF